jgi:HEPN domain-containing protein
MAEFMKHYEIMLNKAKVDFKAAQNLYDDITGGDEELDYEVVLFHLHHSAEKFMKYLLASHEIDYPKVHDLELLADLSDENEIHSGLDTDLLIELSDYAVEGKYSYISEDVKNI